MVLLKFLLFGFAIYFVLKSVARALLPLLFGDVQQKMNDTRRNQNKKKKDGEITIEYKGTGKKSFDKNIGEYIEYEEIKD